MKPSYISAVLMCLLTACSYLNEGEQVGESVYESAIQDASDPELDEVVYTLTPLTLDNGNLEFEEIDGKTYLKVVSWKKEETKNFFMQMLGGQTKGELNTGKYFNWITIPSELKAAIRTWEPADTTQRLIQLLGLPPNTNNGWFIEFGVELSHVFRPCPDPEINDAYCNLCFSDSITEKHKNWIWTWRGKSYKNCDPYQRYPWTQLGYTYDWAPENISHVGLSEFVIDTNAVVQIFNMVRTNEYFRK
jgi:hypothetical protein